MGVDVGDLSKGKVGGEQLQVQPRGLQGKQTPLDFDLSCQGHRHRADVGSGLQNPT